MEFESLKIFIIILGKQLTFENQVTEKLESMRAFIKELLRREIRVFVVEPIPEMGWKIPDLKIKLYDLVHPCQYLIEKNLRNLLKKDLKILSNHFKL